jgi:hypothetical protein
MELLYFLRRYRSRIRGDPKIAEKSFGVIRSRRSRRI